MLIDTSVQAINIILPTTKSNGHKKKKTFRTLCC